LATAAIGGDRHLADAADPKRMSRVRDFNNDRVDHRQVGRDRHAIVEEPRII
jgi:hypothetical protein